MTDTTDSTSNKVHIWGLLPEDKTLLNWSLNLRSTAAGVINFTGVDLLNPLLGQSGLFGDVLRYEFVFDSELGSYNGLPAHGQHLEFQGYSVTNQGVTGAGMGPASTTLDPFYDTENAVWHLATVTYNVVGSGSTDLFLQLGENGLNYQGERSSDAVVVFGNPLDPPLRGELDRYIDSATSDATILSTPGGANGTISLSDIGAPGEAASEFASQRNRTTKGDRIAATTVRTNKAARRQHTARLHEEPTAVPVEASPFNTPLQRSLKRRNEVNLPRISQRGWEEIWESEGVWWRPEIWDEDLFSTRIETHE